MNNVVVFCATNLLRETINEMIDKLVTDSVDAYADESFIQKNGITKVSTNHLSQYFLTEEIMTPSRYGGIYSSRIIRTLIGNCS